jgi:hypothetical protein
MCNGDFQHSGRTFSDYFCSTGSIASTSVFLLGHAGSLGTFRQSNAVMDLWLFGRKCLSYLIKGLRNTERLVSYMRIIWLNFDGFD